VIVAGSLLSVALWFAVYRVAESSWRSTGFSHFLFWLQVIGWWPCIVFRGVHSATKTDFAVIGIPINAGIYAAVIFFLLRIFARIKTSS
jgi:hypothetical protein